jgi:hypothetical protein
MPYFTALSAYLDDQDTLDRVDAFGQFMITAVLSSGQIKRRHGKKLEDPLRLAFMLGVAIGYSISSVRSRRRCRRSCRRCHAWYHQPRVVPFSETSETIRC